MAAQLTRQTLPQGQLPLVGSPKPTTALVSAHTLEFAHMQQRCGATLPWADFALGLGARSQRAAAKMAGDDSSSNCCSRTAGHPLRRGQGKVVEEQEVMHEFVRILRESLGCLSVLAQVCFHLPF